MKNHKWKNNFESIFGKSPNEFQFYMQLDL